MPIDISFLHKESEFSIQPNYQLIYFCRKKNMFGGMFKVPLVVLKANNLQTK